MCGILGAWQLDGAPVDERIVVACRDTLTARGPNDAGVFVSGPVALAHRRLSIIDLSPLGRMPMSNEAGDIWATFNGEIYNFQTLRGELEAHGHQFRSHTDSEVILHSYEQWGTDCFARFDGMFAIGLWDGIQRQMVLARSPHGKKPLYYYYSPGKLLLFGSTMRPLVNWPGFPRELDRQAIYDYMQCEAVYAPRSLIQNTYKVRPGSYVVVDDAGNVGEYEYWNLAEIARRGPLSFGDEQEAYEEFERLMRSAVKKRLVADVPLGAFLSGGIDSSLVVALMAEGSGERVRSFTAGFVPTATDESRYAREVAQRLGVSNEVFSFTGNDILPYVADISRLCDEPIKHYSALPLLAISQAASKEVRVVLTGDGGDELFGGYRYFEWVRRFDYYAKLVGPRLRRILAGAGRWLPGRKLNWLAKHSSAPDAAAFFGELTGRMYDLPIENLLPDGWKPIDQVQFAAAFVRQQCNLQAIEGAMLYDVLYPMVEAILVKADRATMAFSLEARSPLLDQPLSEFAVRMPLSLRHNKRALRRMLTRYLPPQLVQRPKMGFNPPMGDWFRGGLRELLCDALSTESVRRRDLFRPEVVQRLLNEHLNRSHNHVIVLWALLTMELWLREFVDAPAASSRQLSQTEPTGA
ncbi:MAG: asparagine synthase (glutamine-hydrolyzing) [Pirellulales bacterium]|nr:asparagine synthase (glutamine-hydrolyzing) [Pirellulales bacterium]